MARPATAVCAVLLMAAATVPMVMAQDPAPAEVVEEVVIPPVSEARLAQFTVDNLWILIAAILVFIMHLGFASLESGLTRAKNTTNILFKNTCIISIGLLTYWFCGFNLMYPGDFQFLAPTDGDGNAYGILGVAGFFLHPGDGGMTVDYAGGYTYWTDFVFQAMFAATAATIVSGAVAERIKLGPFLLFSILYVGIIYPIYGSWKWGGGFLDANGFYDFAGSTIVHSVGGWGALAGVIVLGPRLGKYLKTDTGESRIHPITGHSMPLATIGVFLLWFGWFGFNGGSVLSAAAGHEGGFGYGSTSLVFTTTAMAAAAGIAGAVLTSWIVQSKPDLSMALNGCLAGLVGITAGADCISVNESVFVGLAAGVLVVLAVIGLDKLKLDDPVGAISVHLVCGILGTLAVGIFGDQGYLDGSGTFGAQLMGVVAAAALCFPAALALFFALKFTTGLRVSREEELYGLDIGEHGMEAYPGFQVYPNR
ncbi:MAG: ammonium transporter [Planctomycetota bacterium]